MGCLLLLAGLVATFGWLAQNVAATQLFFKGAMVSPLGSVALLLLGAALALPPTISAKAASHARLLIAIGLVMISVAGLVGAFGIAGNAIARVTNASPQTLKMHPVGIFVVLLSASILISLNASANVASRLIIKFGTACVAATGIVLFFNQFVNTDYIFMTSGPKTPAFGGAALAIATGIGLWGLWRDSAWNQRPIDAEPSHIYFAMEVLVTAIVGSVALIAFGLSQGRSQDIMIDQMRIVAKDKRLFFHAALNSAYEKALQVSERPTFSSTLALLGKGDAYGSAKNLAASVRVLVRRGVTAVSVTDKSGAVVAVAGSFAVDPEQRVRLAKMQGAELLWDDGYVLRTYLPVFVDHEEIGHIAIEQRLDELTKLQREAVNGEGTNDMVVCALNGNRQQCFPFRWSKTSKFFPAYLDGKPLPITRAASGETATEITTDFRRERVIAALGPIGDTGLGMAVKKDMAEMYAPIRKQFFYTLPFLILLILGSVAMTRVILRPLVESLNAAGAKMKGMAMTDSLTGLPNRAFFNDRLNLAMLRSNRSKATMALMFLDLDKFKTVNDKYGHGAGDDLLKWCASEIKFAVRDSDTVARLGGDEFTVDRKSVV